MKSLKLFGGKIPDKFDKNDELPVKLFGDKLVDDHLSSLVIKKTEEPMNKHFIYRSN